MPAQKPFWYKRSKRLSGSPNGVSPYGFGDYLGYRYPNYGRVENFTLWMVKSTDVFHCGNTPNPEHFSDEFVHDPPAPSKLS